MTICATAENAPAADEIESGATGNTLRLWKAKEALRQAELRLAAQTDSRRAFEARVTTLLGWIIATASVVAAGIFGTVSARVLVALVMLAPLLTAAVLSVSIVWPGWWGNAGYDPRLIFDSSLGTELEIVESMAQGYEESIQRNEVWLRRVASLARAAYGFFALGPLAGAASLLWFTAV